MDEALVDEVPLGDIVRCDGEKGKGDTGNKIDLYIYERELADVYLARLKRI